MTRSARPYAEGGDAGRTYEGFSAETPTAGYYRMAMRMGAMPVGIRIWYGPPHDPVTGEVMDRSFRWQAEINGCINELEKVWPKCARDKITKHEYEYMVLRYNWAKGNAPESPQAKPHSKVDLMTAPLPF